VTARDDLYAALLAHTGEGHHYATEVERLIRRFEGEIRMDEATQRLGEAVNDNCPLDAEGLLRTAARKILAFGGWQNAAVYARLIDPDATEQWDLLAHQWRPVGHRQRKQP
jgi:hypothetical protein